MMLWPNPALEHKNKIQMVRYNKSDFIFKINFQTEQNKLIENRNFG